MKKPVPAKRQTKKAVHLFNEIFMNDWDIEGSQYDADDFCIEIVEV